MYKYYAIGKVVVMQRSKENGEVKRKFYDFGRNIYAEDVDKAFDVLKGLMEKKHFRNTKFYDVVDFAVLQYDIYKLEREGYDWEAHKRVGMGA